MALADIKPSMALLTPAHSGPEGQGWKCDNKDIEYL